MKTLHLVVIIITLFWGTLESSRAQEPPSISVGEPSVTQNGVLENASIPFEFNMSVYGDRSYCCQALANNTDARFESIEDNNHYGLIVPFNAAGGITPPITGVLPVRGLNPAGFARACFTTPSISRSLHFLVIDNSSVNHATFETLRLSCVETTLFGGFNTTAAEFNFLEITNLTGEPLDVHILGYSETANSAKTVDQTISIEPIFGQIKRVDIDLHSLVGPGAFGPLQLTHNGPPGAIKAVVSQYKITSSVDFTLVGQVPLEQVAH